MPRHFDEFVRSSHSSGLIVVAQHVPIQVVVDDRILVWTATQPEDWWNRIVYLPV